MTELWIEPVNERSDVGGIIGKSMGPLFGMDGCGDALLDFWQWWEQGGGSQGSARHLSLRDLIAWATFMQRCHGLGVSPADSFAHGASMSLLDSIGVGDGFSEETARRLRDSAMAKVASLMPAASSTSSSKQVIVSETSVGVAPFFVPRIPGACKGVNFSLDAPTTSCNLERVLRGMQLSKPVLLEGSPGTGKTSLISALAQVCGHRLVRINLSDQTDIMDLLGSDLPVEGEGAKGGGGFAWSDGVFLQVRASAGADVFFLQILPIHFPFHLLWWTCSFRLSQ